MPEPTNQQVLDAITRASEEAHTFFAETRGILHRIERRVNRIEERLARIEDNIEAHDERLKHVEGGRG